MAPKTFDVEITISHANELRKVNRKKFDRLIDQLHMGLLDFPGVGGVYGPNVEATADELRNWDRIEREAKAHNEQRIKEALASILKEPEFQNMVLNGAQEAIAA